VAVGLPFFRSEARRRALGGLALLVALLVAINGMNVVNSFVGRDCMSALAERHAERFYLFAGLDYPAGAVEAPLAERLFQALARSPITYVSTGCPPALLAYHDLQEDGSWRVEPARPVDGPAP
jgi:hypothetical protein